jgi:hypothetical protein
MEGFMPRYTDRQLIDLSHALYDNKFQGLALTVLWWNSCPPPKGYYPIMERPVKDMPLYINDEDEGVRIIATERLKWRASCHSIPLS